MIFANEKQLGSLLLKMKYSFLVHFILSDEDWLEAGSGY